MIRDRLLVTIAAMSLADQIQVLTRGCEHLFTAEELKQRVSASQHDGRQLRVKLGMDPTAPDIHLGHTVVLRKLRQFQNYGHRAVLIIGDYTAMVGDPSGQNSTRPMLSAEQIRDHAATYFEQAGKVLDTDPQVLEVRYNSEWLAEMSFADVLRLASRKTVARMLERDSFEKRFRAGQEIGIHEFLYPLMQGWDSVCVRSDVELGGTDQTFNNLVGRDLQRMEGQDPQIVMITPILTGLDGVEKMSKSLGNYVGITESADDMFSKLMSIPDALMPGYYALLTDAPADEVQRRIAANPRDAKVALARQVASDYHGARAADHAEQSFFTRMKGELPDDIPELAIAAAELQDGCLAAFKLAVLCGFAGTHSEARRLISDGGLRLNQTKLSDPHAAVAIRQGDVVQRGKRRFVRIVLH